MTDSNMLTHHQVLLYVVAFDLFVGFLLARHLWLIRGTEQKRKIPISWLTIICLVNLSGTFCPATVEEAIVGMGGLALAVLIIPAIANQTKTDKDAQPIARPTADRPGPLRQR